ncbi:MAG: P-II family nitrogen regulator [Candidatus Anammoxibacter sp.]
MKKVEAIIRDEKLTAVKECLKDIGIGGMTITEVRGHGTQKGVTEIYRGRSFSVDLLPKIKIEVVVDEKNLKAVTDSITDVARTGSIGDGKIFISTIDEIIRIRTGEKGANAI